MSDFFYEELEPKSEIQNYTKRFWKFFNPTEETKRYTILLDGYFDLIVMCTGEQVDKLTLFGLWTKENEVLVPAGATVFGVCFKPLAAEFIFKQSLANILNGCKELPTDFWNADRLPFTDFDKWVTEVSSQIRVELDSIKRTDRWKGGVFNLLFTFDGAITVQEIAGNVFWTPRQMARYFNNEFGLSLKEYANILRCAATYTKIRDGQLSPNLTYYDQAHFIKEVKRHTGYKPKELYRNKNDRFLQFSTLPRK